MAINVSDLRGRRVTDRQSRASIGDIWERQVWSTPDAVAIIAADGAFEDPAHARLTYAEADELANKFAHGLIESGLRNGDIAILVCGNSTEAMVAKIGMAKAGVVAAPLNPVLGPEVIGSVVDRIGAKAALVDTEYLPKVNSRLTSSRVNVLATVGATLASSPGTPSFTEFTSDRANTEPETEIHGDDVWQLLFTSGTTGIPKAAMLSHHNTYYAALAWTGTLGLGVRHERDAVFASFLPIVFHTGDVLAYSTWLAGGTVVIGRQPNPKYVATAISEHGVTALWSGMPQAVRALVEALEADPSLAVDSLASDTYGWAPLDEEVYDRLNRVAGHRVRVQSIIGMTEVVVAHRFWLDEHEELFRRTTPRDNYVGLPNPVLAARLADPATGETVPRQQGMLGEAVYRSPALTGGYYRDQESTDRAMAGGWFHTGDLFGYGEDGQRMMVDRLKDVVKSGGENVSSIRVEAVLEQHPSVVRAAVVGISHPRWGEAVTAAVIRQPGSSPTAEELITYCRERLASYEVPKAVVFVDDLPTSVGGKLQKQAIKALVVSMNPYPTESGMPTVAQGNS